MATDLKIKKIAAAIEANRVASDELKEKLRPLEKVDEKLREEMLQALKNNKLNGFKTDAGITYTRAYRVSLSITDAARAIKWATSHNCARVDTVKAAKLLREVPVMPEGFEETETEYLTIRTHKDDSKV